MCVCNGMRTVVHAQNVDAFRTAGRRHLADELIDVVGVAAEAEVVVGTIGSKLPNGAIVLRPSKVGQQIDEA